MTEGAVAVVDYGMGNLRSVLNAVTALGRTAFVATEPADLRRAVAVILPGVGAFADGMRNLRDGGWVEPLQRDVKNAGKPFLGICLGMELLATGGMEHGWHEGLDWVAGVVDRLPAASSAIKVPHIGWNDVRIVREDGLYVGLGGHQSFYFVHSYYFAPRDAAVVSAVCGHGMEFAASVESDNVVGTQYHPEKSQKAGLAVLRNFLSRRA